ncbi:hypothetical protein FHX49_000600 [Microbacterium endophyticum]|uniref:Uncharacterized protein n=1 Tax=Microbacterium endophyticum TaxID=1526412 RepID=A0A7W4V1K9_9MICO|nr:hypothetical protein [Microbacterium endophyticum]MBB2975059.1 hypothetical protein [Microbacterium endophyticum]NIK37401.1 hypothetical protein [Microbacterium endophyticum]
MTFWDLAGVGGSLMFLIASLALVTRARITRLLLRRATRAEPKSMTDPNLESGVGARLMYSAIGGCFIGATFLALAIVRP